MLDTLNVKNQKLFIMRICTELWAIHLLINDLFCGSENSFFYLLSAININIPVHSLRNFTDLRAEFYRTGFEKPEPVTKMTTLFIIGYSSL